MARIKKNTGRKFKVSGNPFVVTGMVTVLIEGIIAALVGFGGGEYNLRRSKFNI
jgi:hypothetical protein